MIGRDPDSERWLLLVINPWDFSSACSPRVLLLDACGFVCIAIDIQLRDYVCVCVCVCACVCVRARVCACVHARMCYGRTI